ncbi:MAG: hypothetical protein ACJ8D5_00985 [Sphingomicrobium sp.]
MAKAKKKKNKGKKGKSAASTAGSALHSMSRNPLVADVVAAALVATAAALKDSNRARRLAEEAGDELAALSKKGAERGNALWQLALDVGRKAVESFSADDAQPAKAKRAPKRAKSSQAKKSGTVAKAAKKPKRAVPRKG